MPYASFGSAIFVHFITRTTSQFKIMHNYTAKSKIINNRKQYMIHIRAMIFFTPNEFE